MVQERGGRDGITVLWTRSYRSKWPGINYFFELQLAYFAKRQLKRVHSAGQVEGVTGDASRNV